MPSKLDDVNEDEILERLAQGGEMTALASEYGVHRATLYRWLEATPERAKKYDIAKRLSSYHLAAEGGRILDELAELSAEELTAPRVTLAAKRADYRRWLAGVRNPEFADKGVTVNNNTLNIGSLHLDALRAANQPALPAAPKQIEGEVVDAEIVDSEPDEVA